MILLKLPNGHGAESVRRAMTKRILTLPAQLRRSITFGPSNRRTLGGAYGWAFDEIETWMVDTAMALLVDSAHPAQ